MINALLIFLPQRKFTVTMKKLLIAAPPPPKKNNKKP
jgi:hypothetical protein